MKKKSFQKSVIAVLTLLVALLFAIAETSFDGNATSVPPDVGMEEEKVPDVVLTEQEKLSGVVYAARVVDGDTLVVSVLGKEEKVRLLGIDTPESVDPRKPVQCFGKEAGEHLASIVMGKKMTLVMDPSQASTDKYDRWLRILQLEDGTDVNKQMITDGYAYEYTYDKPYIRQQEYKQEMENAKLSKRGLWASDTCNGER
jgi:micrococcal nuclease